MLSRKSFYLRFVLLTITASFITFDRVSNHRHRLRDILDRIYSMELVSSYVGISTDTSLVCYTYIYFLGYVFLHSHFTYCFTGF